MTTRYDIGEEVWFIDLAEDALVSDVVGEMVVDAEGVIWYVFREGELTIPECSCFATPGEARERYRRL